MTLEELKKRLLSRQPQSNRLTISIELPQAPKSRPEILREALSREDQFINKLMGEIKKEPLMVKDTIQPYGGGA